MKVGIIGAGIGGLSTASLFAKYGFEVDVYEREKLLGGRSLSAYVDDAYLKLLKKYKMSLISSTPDIDTLPNVTKNYTADLGFHLIGGGKNGALAKLLRLLGINLPFIGSRLGLIGPTIEYPIVNTFEKLTMIPRIFQLLFSRKSKIEEMKTLSVEDLINQYGKGKMKLLLELFPRLITTVNDLSSISAAETLFAQRELMGGDPVVYPIGGLSKISESLASYISSKKGNIYLNSKVNKIIVDDGKAIGLRSKKTEHNYDIVVSSVPIQHIFSIADTKDFPGEYVKYVKGLEPTGSVVSYHAVRDLDERFKNKSFVFVEKDVNFNGGAVAGMIDFKMNHSNGVAPNGRCIIQSYAICTPSEAKNKKKREELVSIIENNLAALMPTNRNNIEWVTHSAIWHLDGVAKTIGSPKPDIVTPVKNLYIAGDCVSSKGVGVNCAADSANMILHHILSSDLND